MDPVRKFGLVGFPIKHSLSPQLFAKAFPEHFRPGAAEPWTYDLIEEKDFENAWKRFIDGYLAVNVTSPFKGDAAARADTVSPEVSATGAANILIKTPDGVAAFNSDYLAVLSILKDELRRDRAGVGCHRAACPPSGASEGGARAQSGRDERSEPNRWQPTPAGSCAVIGTGGAGRAAKAAAEALGLETSFLHHDEIAGGVEADIVIFTLPKPVPGIENIRCRILLEANYKDPCLAGIDAIYIPGTQWLQRQAEEGYRIMEKFF